MVEKRTSMLVYELVPFLRDWKLFSLNKKTREIFMTKINEVLVNMGFNEKIVENNDLRSIFEKTKCLNSARKVFSKEWVIQNQEIQDQLITILSQSIIIDKLSEIVIDFSQEGGFVYFEKWDHFNLAAGCFVCLATKHKHSVE